MGHTYAMPLYQGAHIICKLLGTGHIFYNHRCLTITYMPSIFTEFHADMLHMSVASNGCKRITHGRCALTAWPEARALRSENTRALGLWLFEDVIC